MNDNINVRFHPTTKDGGLSAHTIRKRGRIIYAPKPLIDFADEVQLQEKMKKGKSLSKVVEYARVGREVERILKRIGYL